MYIFQSRGILGQALSDHGTEHISYLQTPCRLRPLDEICSLPQSPIGVNMNSVSDSHAKSPGAYLIHPTNIPAHGLN